MNTVRFGTLRVAFREYFGEQSLLNDSYTMKA